MINLYLCSQPSSVEEPALSVHGSSLRSPMVDNARQCLRTSSSASFNKLGFFSAPAAGV